jgi:hypothetical protein
MGVEGGAQAKLYSPDQYQYMNLQFNDHCLVGCRYVIKTQHIGVLRGLIESRIKLNVWRQRLINNPTLIMQAYMACTQELEYSE